MSWQSFGQTDQGLVRLSNQDAFGLYDDLGLWIVADGMGGHAGGEVASRLTIETIGPFLKKLFDPASPNLHSSKNDGDLLCEAIEAANHTIHEHAYQNQELTGMGTTVVALLISNSPNSQATIAHAGDSRAYLIREETILPLTRDHSLVEERIDLGLLSPEEALTHPLRHVLTKGLGIESLALPTVQTIPIQPTDLFLLCSDGLSKMMNDDQILEIMLKNQSSLKECCHQLVEVTNQLGGQDNVTVVLIGNQP